MTGPAVPTNAEHLPSQGVDTGRPVSSPAYRLERGSFDEEFERKKPALDVARSFGTRYTGFIRELLDPTGSGYQSPVSHGTDRVADFETSLREITRAGFVQNASAFSVYKENPIVGLFTHVATVDPSLHPINHDAIARASKDAVVVQPTPGLVVIEMTKPGFEDLKLALGVHAAGGAVALLSDNPDHASLLVITRGKTLEPLGADLQRLTNNSVAHHETHHWVLRFAESADLVKPAREATPEKSQAFRNFRNELMAYIVEGRDLSNVEPIILCYSMDKSCLNTTEKYRDFAVAALELHRRHGGSSTDLLWPVINSTSFTELQSAVKELVPLPPPKSALWLDTAADLFLNPPAWKRTDGIKMLLGDGNFTSDDHRAIETWAVERLSRASQGSIPVAVHAANLAAFAASVGVAMDPEDLARRSLAETLRVSPATYRALMQLPEELRQKIPPRGDAKDICDALISPGQTGDQEKLRAYRGLLAAAPELREAFTASKHDYLDKWVGIMRREYKRLSPEEFAAKFEATLTSYANLDAP